MAKHARSWGIEVDVSGTIKLQVHESNTGQIAINLTGNFPHSRVELTFIETFHSRVEGHLKKLLRFCSPSLHLNDSFSPSKPLGNAQSAVLAFFVGAQNAHVG